MGFGSSAFGSSGFGGVQAPGPAPEEPGEGSGEVAPLTLTVRLKQGYDTQMWRDAITADVTARTAAYAGVPDAAHFTAAYADLAYVFTVVSAAYPPGTETRPEAELASLVFLPPMVDAPIAIQTATAPHAGMIVLTLNKAVQYALATEDEARYTLTPASSTVRRVELGPTGDQLALWVLPALTASTTLTIADGTIVAASGEMLAVRTASISVTGGTPLPPDPASAGNVAFGQQVTLLNPELAAYDRDIAQITGPYQHSEMPGVAPEAWFQNVEQYEAWCARHFTTFAKPPLLVNDQWYALDVQVDTEAAWVNRVVLIEGGTAVQESTPPHRATRHRGFSVSCRDPITGFWFSALASAPASTLDAAGRTARFRRNELVLPKPVYTDAVRVSLTPHPEQPLVIPYENILGVVQRVTIAGVEVLRAASPPATFAVQSVTASDASTVTVVFNQPPLYAALVPGGFSRFTIDGNPVAGGALSDALTVVLTPTAPLAPGTHTLSIDNQNQGSGFYDAIQSAHSGQGLSLNTFNFTVEAEEDPDPDPVDDPVDVRLRLADSSLAGRAAAQQALVAIYADLVRGVDGPEESALEGLLFGRGVTADVLEVSLHTAATPLHRLVLGEVTYLAALGGIGATLFSQALGTQQGRIRLADGTHVFELGHAAFLTERALVGDTVCLRQPITLGDGGEVTRIRVRLRAPRPRAESARDEWLFQVMRYSDTGYDEAPLGDETVFYERVIAGNGAELTLYDVAVPWFGQDMNAVLEFRLTLLGEL